MKPDQPDDQTLTRREALASAGAAGLAVGLSACGGGRTGGATTSERATTAATRACVLTPEQSEGPFYVKDSLLRRDITESRPGVPLDLRLAVEEVESCAPIRNATVEVWHCDASGVYSGAADKTTFLRGAQRTNGEGLAVFRTIYPGWYPGRTPHIHVKVHAGGDEVHTGQLYFPDSVSLAVYRRPPYAARGRPAIGNASDGIYADGGRQSTMALGRSGEGYVGRMSLGIRT